MKTVTYYVASDGSQHPDIESAEFRDRLLRRVERIMTALQIPADASAAISDNKGYWQHNLETIAECKEGLLEICRARGFGKSYQAFSHHGREVHPLSIVGRVLSESTELAPVCTAWRRFGRIDEQGREWQQCYFAYNAQEKPDVSRLNPA